LPKAHVEAPTRARIILAGLLLKLGTGGFLRVLSLLNFSFFFFFFVISFLGMLLCCLLCFVQRDLKSLAAYSSINHMSFFLLVVLMSGVIGKFSGVLVMVSHGFISTLMFFVIGEFYHISFTRNIYFLGGFFFFDFVLLFVFLLV
jgi:NADH:ubiquinone oxidoreductase subunit 4 (subunit M)